MSAARRATLGDPRRIARGECHRDGPAGAGHMRHRMPRARSSRALHRRDGARRWGGSCRGRRISPVSGSVRARWARSSSHPVRRHQHEPRHAWPWSSRVVRDADGSCGWGGSGARKSKSRTVGRWTNALRAPAALPGPSPAWMAAHQRRHDGSGTKTPTWRGTQALACGAAPPSRRHKKTPPCPGGV